MSEDESSESSGRNLTRQELAELEETLGVGHDLMSELL